MSDKIRVVIVDDHTLFREGLAELLEHYGTIHVCGIAGTQEIARNVIREQQPDVVLLDLHLPPTDGITLMQKLREEGLFFTTLILTVSNEEEDLASALRAGAQGYLLKNMEPAEVVDAIQRADKGETVVAPEMTAKLVTLLDNKKGKTTSLINQLTAREREILQYLAKGDSNKAIAKELGISADTVKLHVRNILSKLNLTSRVEAAVFAVEQKLTPPRHS